MAGRVSLAGLMRYGDASAIVGGMACEVLPVVRHNASPRRRLWHRSYRTGRKIYWDDAKEQIVNDPEANGCLSKEYRRPWSLQV
jgi:hypothetical protein